MPAARASSMDQSGPVQLARSGAPLRTGSRPGRSSRRTASKTITSSPGSTSASIAAIMRLGGPAGDTDLGLRVDGPAGVGARDLRRRWHARKSRAPQVIAYWLTSASMAAFAASLSSDGHGKSGKPWARLTAPCACGEAGHVADDRLGERFRLGADTVPRERDVEIAGGDARLGHAPILVAGSAGPNPGPRDQDSPSPAHVLHRDQATRGVDMDAAARRALPACGGGRAATPRQPPRRQPARDQQQADVPGPGGRRAGPGGACSDVLGKAEGAWRAARTSCASTAVTCARVPGPRSRADCAASTARPRTAWSSPTEASATRFPTRTSTVPARFRPAAICPGRPSTSPPASAPPRVAAPPRRHWSRRPGPGATRRRRRRAAPGAT